MPEQEPDPARDGDDEPLGPVLRPVRWDPFDEPSDDREPALRVATETLHVHHVEAIRIKTLRFPVHRHRFPGRSSKIGRLPGQSLDDVL